MVTHKTQDFGTFCTTHCTFIVIFVINNIITLLATYTNNKWKSKQFDPHPPRPPRTICVTRMRMCIRDISYYILYAYLYVTSTDGDREREVSNEKVGPVKSHAKQNISKIQKKN